MEHEIVFTGKLLHNSLLRYKGKKGNTKVSLLEGDIIEFHSEKGGEVKFIFHNGKDIGYKEEVTPLESIVDACEEV